MLVELTFRENDLRKYVTVLDEAIALFRVEAPSVPNLAKFARRLQRHLQRGVADRGCRICGAIIPRVRKPGRPRSLCSDHYTARRARRITFRRSDVKRMGRR